MLGRNLRIDSDPVAGTRVNMRGYPWTDDSSALAKRGLSRNEGDVDTNLIPPGTQYGASQDKAQREGQPIYDLGSCC